MEYMDEEQEMQELYEKAAVVLGYLAYTFNKISLANFNKIWSELGYERIKRTEFEDYADIVESDLSLHRIFGEAADGEISVEDIADYQGESITRGKSIHDIISPYQVQHQRVLANNREFSRIQREGAAMSILMEDLKKHLKEELHAWDVPVKLYPLIEGKKNTLVVLISDWHIGATINKSYDHGGYNFSILQKRLNKLLSESKEVADRYQVEAITCLFVGDMIEGADMRGNQKWGLEYGIAEQISRGTTTLLDFLSALEDIAPVTFGAVSGNHDRLTGQANKKDKIYNDHAMYVILEMLMLVKASGVLPNTTIIDNLDDMGDLETTVYDKVFHVNHGEGRKITESQLKNFVKDHAVDYLITGHVHHFKAMQDDKDRLHIIVGSPMGYNDYSKSLNLNYTSPSQALLVLSEDGDQTIKNIYLAE